MSANRTANPLKLGMIFNPTDKGYQQMMQIRAYFDQSFGLNPSNVEIMTAALNCYYNTLYDKEKI